MYYKTASIILNSEQKSNSVSDIFISQPDKNKESLAGKLFILAEIESQRANSIKIINFLVNNLNFNYYQNDKIILKEKIENITVESIFETSLAKTNKDLLDFLEREKIKISPYAFNVTVLVLYKNEVYFSTVGKNKNLLIYKEKKQEKKTGRKKETIETIEYKIANVSGVKNKRSETVIMSKLFSDAINGKIPSGGSFLIINEALSEYISNKQLIKIITTISPAGASEQIKNILKKVNSFVSFLGIIIKSTTTALSTDELKKEIDEIEEDDYRPKITELEEKTEEILKPAGIINFKRSFKNLTKRFSQSKSSNILNISKKNQEESLMFKEKIFFKKRIPSIQKLFIFLLKAFKLAGILFLFLLKKITNHSKLSGFFKKIKYTSGEKNKNLVNTHRKIKIALIVAIILLIIFSVNIVIINKKNKAEEEKKQFNILINAIEKNQNKVEANLLYNNENKAKELIKENEELLKNILKENEKREDIDNLFKKQEEQIEKIRHVIKIENPEEIANFSNLNNQANAENIFLYNQKLYSADSKEKSIYKIDLIEDIVTALYDMKEEIKEMRFPTINNQNGIYYLDKENIIYLTNNETINFLDIELPGNIANVVDIESYNNNLYLIEKEKGQIYKYTKYRDAFVNREKWLNKKEDLDDAVDLFIDGNIYVFYRDGRIKKYLRGGEQEFTIEKTYIPITEASGFTISKKYIYILEPKQKRLIVFEKYGDFSRQYIFKNMDDIRGFSINKNEENAYILNNNSVYEIDIKD